MRGKRSKQYRKLMEQYSMTFGFREPYQVLVDAEMVRDSCRFKMDLAAGLERTVHGKVKPMITQCEIRKLYANKTDPSVRDAVELAKTYERRRCGHHPDEFPDPLSTRECMLSVVDPKQTGQNKHRYVVASQDQDVRRVLRAVRGVPQIYIKRSVMILEPMADDSVQVRAREERAKFRAELKPSHLGKRKRLEEDNSSGEKEVDTTIKDKKKKRVPGVKGPNPLSMKKPKKRPKTGPEARPGTTLASHAQGPVVEEEPAKKKRKRKSKAVELNGTNASSTMNTSI